MTKTIFLGRFFFLFFSLCVIIFFTFARIYNIGLPVEKVFDEVYFPVMAHQLLTVGSYYDTHPPMGKLIIALSEMMFGNNTLGWRFTSLVAGIAFLAVIYVFTRELLKDKTTALITTLLFAVDGLFIVYSRVGLIDIFMLLFGFCAFLCVLKFSKSHAKYLLLLAGIFCGVTLSVKWIGVGFWFLAVVYTIFFYRSWLKSAKNFALFVLFLLIVPIIVYLVSFIPLYKMNIIHETIKWHIQAWKYHSGLSEGHVYGSKWWGWPIMIRPIWFYYKDNGGIVRGIIALANPLILWLSTASIVASVGLIIASLNKKIKFSIKNSELKSVWFLLSAWLIFYLPWIFITRVAFFYHYMMAYSFAVILLGYFLAKIKNFSSLLFSFLIILIVFFGLIYLPLWTGYPVEYDYYRNLMLFKSWI